MAAAFLALGYAFNAKDAADSRAIAAEARAHASEVTAQAAADLAKIAEREARMDEYYIMELDGKVIKLGIELPEGGYQRFKQNHRGDK
jgi:hypothetical protein